MKSKIPSTDHVLIDWNEKQQAFLFNAVTDGRPKFPPGQAGYVPILRCASDKEAFYVAQFLENIFGIGSAKPQNISVVKMRATARRLVKLFSQLSKSEKKGWAVMPY